MSEESEDPGENLVLDALNPLIDIPEDGVQGYDEYFCFIGISKSRVSGEPPTLRPVLEIEGPYEEVNPLLEQSARYIQEVIEDYPSVQILRRDGLDDLAVKEEEE